MSLRHSPVLEMLAEAGSAIPDCLCKGPSPAISLPISFSYILKMIIREHHPSGTWKLCYLHAQMRTEAERCALLERCSDPWWCLGKLGVGRDGL